MSAAAVVLMAIGLFVLTLNVFYICETWERTTRMKLGELPGKELMQNMLEELKEQRISETGDYSRYFNEGINLAIDIAERYEKDFG